jgi:hypothetical protein
MSKNVKLFSLAARMCARVVFPHSHCRGAGETNGWARFKGSEDRL